MFDAVRAPLDALTRSDVWPDIESLNALAEGLVNARGLPLRFVPSDGNHSALTYESQIAERGCIATREHNWHDLFNALTWVCFPTAKGAISEMHASILAERGSREAKNRSVQRDVLTLFDEGGMIIASANSALTELLRAFRWKDLFVANRPALESSMRFYLFGHAMLEKALDPHVGVTARAIIVPVDEVFLAASREAQRGTLDQHLARWLSDPLNLTSTRHLHPVPFLGVPGWCAENASHRFYDNTDYFRPGRGFGRGGENAA
jgi:hypothetical protein